MDNLEQLISMNMLLVTLRMAIPLILASIGSVICERSGIINLGIEGMMLAGALGAVIGTSIFPVSYTHLKIDQKNSLRIIWIL